MERLQYIQRQRILSVKSYHDFSTIAIDYQSFIDRSSIVIEINSRNLRCVNRILFSQHVVDKWIVMSRTVKIYMELFGIKYVRLNLRYLYLYDPIKFFNDKFDDVIPVNDISTYDQDVGGNWHLKDPPPPSFAKKHLLVQSRVERTAISDQN